MRDLKLLFINPCLRRNTQVKILPVGLAYVMTVVAEANYSFDLLDVDIHEYEDEFVESYIKTHKYDVILFGSIVTHYKWIKWLTKTIKLFHPETIVIVGNSVGGSCYEVFMKNAPADFVVVGEGEYTCLELLNALRDGTGVETIPGIIHRSADGNIIKNRPRKACDINKVPIIDWEFFEVDQYIQGSQRNTSFGVDDASNCTITMPVCTARGCAFKCSFCHYVFWDDPYRHRSPQNIIEEIRRNIEEYGANYINFWDDLSFASITQVEKLVDAILSSGLKFGWSAAVRTDLFGNPRFSLERRMAVAEKMKASGCAALGFSLESG
ncbi:MAG: B12-binding domain-containing radical SAM protein, partial [Anaerolineae bacterium]|nr:B12-binding domain-containing radical SAM protein [Anaerolineae bacterium]